MMGLPTLQYCLQNEGYAGNYFVHCASPSFAYSIHGFLCSGQLDKQLQTLARLKRFNIGDGSPFREIELFEISLALLLGDEKASEDLVKRIESQ